MRAKRKETRRERKKSMYFFENGGNCRTLILKVIPMKTRSWHENRFYDKEQKWSWGNHQLIKLHSEIRKGIMRISVLKDWMTSISEFKMLRSTESLLPFLKSWFTDNSKFRPFF